MSDAADLLITNGRVFVAYRPSDLTPYGSDIGPRPVAAANAVAVRHGKIAWVGREAEGLRDWLGPATDHVDARGGLITGGFDDAHVHLVDGATQGALPPGTSRNEADAIAAMRRAIATMHAAGITSIQDGWVEPGQVPLWRALLDDGTVRMRIRLALAMTPGGTLEEWRATLDGYEAITADLRGHPWLDFGIIKARADGDVATRTAALLGPYAGDDAAVSPAWEPADLDAFVAEADARGWQLAIHAVGDAAIRMALDSYERAAAANPAPERGRRHRIEHIETVARPDIPRFGALGVVASMQPFHADPNPGTTEVWAEAIGPERAGQAWSWASIRREGGVVALGSDWPVAPFDPFLALNVAVNRQTVDGHPAGGWLPSEKMSLPDALAAYGHGSAYAAFADHRRGTLRAGMDADLVVLDRDLLAGGPSSIIGTTVALTVVGGQVVHRSEALP